MCAWASSFTDLKAFDSTLWGTFAVDVNIKRGCVLEIGYIYIYKTIEGRVAKSLTRVLRRGGRTDGLDDDVLTAVLRSTVK